MLRRRLLVLLTAVALLGAACGGDDEATTTTTEDGGQEALANLQGQTLEVAGVWSGDEQANFQKVLDLFKQKTGAEVRFT
jgi:alpha-glucoside transport system substrate-binding protein